MGLPPFKSPNSQNIFQPNYTTPTLAQAKQRIMAVFGFVHMAIGFITQLLHT